MSISVKEKILIATFMDFPTKKLKGRITDGFAKKEYNDYNSLIAVVEKIEGMKIQDFSPSVDICGSSCCIKLWRIRKNTGFKDGTHEYKTIAYFNEGKLISLQKSIVAFLNWLNDIK